MDSGKLDKENRSAYIGLMKKQKKEYLEVMADDMNSKFDILIDANKMLNDKVAGIQETLNSHTETLNSHTETLNSHTEMIGSIKTDVEIIKEDVAFLKNDIKHKVDIEEFSALKRKIRQS